MQHSSVLSAFMWIVFDHVTLLTCIACWLFHLYLGVLHGKRAVLGGNEAQRDSIQVLEPWDTFRDPDVTLSGDCRASTCLVSSQPGVSGRGIGISNLVTQLELTLPDPCISWYLWSLRSSSYC